MTNCGKRVSLGAVTVSLLNGEQGRSISYQCFAKCQHVSTKNVRLVKGVVFHERYIILVCCWRISILGSGDLWTCLVLRFYETGVIRRHGSRQEQDL